MATQMKKKVRLDGGYLNAFGSANRRSRNGNYRAELMGGGVFIPQDILESAYVHNGFARLICDKPAEEMTRAGFDVKDLPEKTEQQVKARLEELEAVKKLNEAIKWRRAFGGSLILMGLMDGGNLQDPLNEQSLKSVEYLRVYDKYEARPSSYYTDSQSEKFGEIQTWQISPKMGGINFDVHESRVLVFDGEAVPNNVRASNDGWGASIIQNAFVQLGRLDSSHKFALLLMERMQQAVHKIPNLSEQISTPEGEKEVTRRVEVVDYVRGIMNTVIIDALEEFEIQSMTISGIKDVLEQFAEALSAVTGIPIFILMGRNVGGLSNGDSNKEGWYAQIEAWQNDVLRRPVDRLVSLIILTITKGDSDGGDYTLEFCPLYTPSDKDVAETELKKEQAAKTKMETLTGYANAGMMDQDEGREEIREDYDLVGDAPEPEEEPTAPITLNPGQKLVAPVPGQNNPAKPIVGKKKAGK